MFNPTPSPDQQLAITAIKQGEHRYNHLEGGPGCGKSFVVKTLHDMGYPLIKTSTTGISAINIGGTTINSLLGYFDSADMRKKHDSGRIYEALRTHVGKTIGVDETSMLSAAQLQIMMLNNERLYESTGACVNFLLIGDFGQLPPVKEEPAFESPLWKYVHTYSLTHVHRTTDKEFINALRHLRVGDARTAVHYFNDLGFHSDIDMSFEGTTLYSLNYGAQVHNEYSLSQLQGESMYYYPIKEGDPLPEWKNIPDPLELKVGALVILRSNQWDMGYANGDQGYVVSMGSNVVTVDLLRGGRVDVAMTAISHKTSTKRGRITFMPIILAYALTTHKAQSLSIDHLQVVLDDPNADGNLRFMGRCHGMAFMAISRATTPNNLRIVGDRHSFIQACYCDKKYLPYIQ